MAGGQSVRVCVTGGSGFIASCLVARLLGKGYAVRATVRNPGDTEKTAHLRSLPFADERLELVQADLLEEGSFNEAVKGCDAVFHTASPFFVTNITNPQAQLLDPAVKGTLNLLRAVAATDGIRRVVLTSSTAAVAWDPNRDPTAQLDESCWSSEEFCIQNKMWYHLSKTQAEKAAWKFAEEKGIDLVTINPAMVIGKMLQPTLNTSSASILKYLTGENQTYPNSVMGWVHVEDVADAHILAYENPKAEGRYLCVCTYLHWRELLTALQQICPEAHITQKCADDNPDALPPLLNTDKLKGLGLHFRTMQTMLIDTAASLRERGFYKP